MENHGHQHAHGHTGGQLTPDAVTDSYPTEATGLPQATGAEILELGDGDTVELRVAPVAKQLGDTTVRMLAYNGSIPGPTLKVRQGGELVVHVANHAGLDTTVHWHGLRLENRYDGVPGDTQHPIPVGGVFTYRLSFPDPGLYWYHPHIREDYTQELGLYGNILVLPTDPEYWPPADADLVLTIDDLLLEDGRIAPFSRTETTYAAMGRYGNVFLTAGQPEPRFTLRAGDVTRLWLTDTANTRTFNLAIPGARIKLVGGDSGRVEREQWITETLLAPSERVVLDVLFDAPGEYHLEHHTPRRTYTLATVTAEPYPTLSAAAAAFPQSREAPELVAERKRLPFTDPPDKVLALVATIDDPSAPTHAGSVTYRCPMHPEVTSTEPGRCPRCGMKLLATSDGHGDIDPTGAVIYACPMHPEVTSTEPGHCPKCGMKLLAASPPPAASVVPSGDAEAHAERHPPRKHSTPPRAQERDDLVGIEWEDDMLEANRGLTSARVHWRVVDRTSGTDREAFDWQFTVGERVKIRVVNEAVSDHPMHHPFHIHGAGRFVVLARDDVAEQNLMWKDTVLIRAGESVDLLLDVTQPGRWMAHCHIAEHLQSGMMFSFTVTGRNSSPVR